MIKTAIIGINGFGKTHYNDLLREVQSGRCQLRAAVIRNPQDDDPRIATLKKLGTEIFTNHQEMFSKVGKELDLCCIPTGITSHLPLTVEALKAGVNVFVEKPVTPTYREALAMKEAEKASGKFVAVGYQDIFQEKAQRIKSILLSGRLGSVKMLKCYVLWPRLESYYCRNSWAGHVFDDKHMPVLDAPFTNATGHFLNLLNFYAGQTSAGTADLYSLEAVMTRCNNIETCDTAGIKLTTTDHKTLLFLCTHASESRVDPISEIVCEKGFICYTPTHIQVLDLQRKVQEEFDAPTYGDMRIPIYDALFERISNPRRFICTVEQAAATVLIGNAVFDSTPIINVPDEYSYEKKSESGSQQVMKSIDGVFKTCFVEGRLPNQLDYPFLKNPRTFYFAGYQGFDGRLFK